MRERGTKGAGGVGRGRESTTEASALAGAAAETLYREVHWPGPQPKEPERSPHHPGGTLRALGVSRSKSLSICVASCCEVAEKGFGFAAPAEHMPEAWRALAGCPCLYDAPESPSFPKAWLQSPAHRSPAQAAHPLELQGWTADRESRGTRRFELASSDLQAACSQGRRRRIPHGSCRSACSSSTSTPRSRSLGLPPDQGGASTQWDVVIICL